MAYMRTICVYLYMSCNNRSNTTLVIYNIMMNSVYCAHV